MRRQEARSHEKFEGVYWIVLEDGARRLSTKNLSPGDTVYGERLVKIGKTEYRIWDAYRSKLAAAILKTLDFLPIAPGGKILYLGAASGTTASHVSDIVGEKGIVYCVEFAQRAIRELVDNVCENRPNVYPVLADARFPEKYRSIVGEVDSIYCDIAQPEQARVLADNADMYLKSGGGAVLAVKSRSIDVTVAPSRIFRQEIETLRKRRFEIQDTVRLEPYDKDHAMVSATFKER
jgi:fibrillarin-like pre-rRNA processing protein